MNLELEHSTVATTIGTYEALLGDKHAHVCVTSWPNGEGYDVELNEKGCCSLFQMTHDQWTALKKVMKNHLNRG